MKKEMYSRFVNLLVEKYGAKWAAIIIGEDGDIPAYRAFDESLTKKFLRSSRSLYWTFMNIGEAAGLPDLDGKFLETIWKQDYFYNYLYIIRLEDEVLMLATEQKIEEFMMNMVSTMNPEDAPGIKGMIGFGIGDYEGNAIETYVNMDRLNTLGKKEYEEEEVKSLLEKITKEIFERVMFMGEAGFGEGEYMEVHWKNVAGWMFPYKDNVAVAIFESSKRDTIINIMSYALKNIGSTGD